MKHPFIRSVVYLTTKNLNIVIKSKQFFVYYRMFSTQEQEIIDVSSSFEEGDLLESLPSPVKNVGPVSIKNNSKFTST